MPQIASYITLIVAIPPCLLNASQCTAYEQASASLAPPGLSPVPRHVSDELLVAVSPGSPLSAVAAVALRPVIDGINTSLF